MHRCVLTALLVGLVVFGMDSAQAGPATREAIVEALGEGNWAEALDYAKLRLKKPEAEPYDLTAAVTCLERLGRLEEVDALLERVVRTHGSRPAMALAAAEQYKRLPPYGTEIAGTFRRGDSRGSGVRLNVAEVDRVRRIRLLRGLLAGESATDAERAAACEQLADALLAYRAGRQSWRLQSLTETNELPAPEEARGWGRGGNTSASDPPVREDGTPVLYETPTDWESATNDGERWRWALAEAVRRDASREAWADVAYANFLNGQFGVQALVSQGWFASSNTEPDQEASRAALRSLDDDETIARLASGVRRFRLPAGHRYIELYEKHGRWGALAQIRLARHQRALAAEAFRRSIEGVEEERQRKGVQAQIDQIEQPWALFATQKSWPAGREPTLRVRHRNTDRLRFTARRIDIRRLLADAQAALLNGGGGVGDDRLNLERIGYRLVQESGERYLEDDRETWDSGVDRGEDHADTFTDVSAPLTEPGAYFVSVSPADDATPSSVVVWVADTVLVKKRTVTGAVYLVLDAIDGRPIADAKLEFFGYRLLRRRDGEAPGEDRRFETTRFEKLSDANGVVEVVPDDSPGTASMNWIVTATDGEGRLAFHGLQGLWQRYRPDTPPEAPRTYLVTDRPAYRPGSTVRFKAWIGRADYSVEADGAASEFAHKAFQVELRDARYEKIETLSLTANRYGAIGGEFEIAQDAPLGRYAVSIVGFGGGGAFRVEEYRKPEFEVAVEGPANAPRPGESFEATVRADYYFGSPVSGGRVRYRVERRPKSTAWIPPGPWDWLYGRGYGWLGQEASWRSDWSRWGCVCPPPWEPFNPGPPELVAEGEATLNAAGEYRVVIETTDAAERRPDDDYEYTLTAEVTDLSRRTVNGTGKFLVARQPLVAHVGLDRGHYDVGDTITARVVIRRPDGEPKPQAGRLRLLRIEPSDDADRPTDETPRPLPPPTETEVQAWDLSAGPDGEATMRLKASEPGRYRLAFETAPIDFGGDTTRVEAAAVFTIRGPGFDGRGFRFGALEIIPDKSEYRPGESARVLVNTDRADATVALFVRPVGGVYAAPEMIRLDGKSRLVELPIEAADQPNFFVEAVTVADGRLHAVTKQIVVPPTPRVLNVDAVTSSDAFLPGQEGTLRLRVTDAAGEPVVGEVTVAVYDRAVDAVASDIVPGDIRERFWSWRRQHRPATWHNLLKYEPAVAPPGATVMQPVGMYDDWTWFRRGAKLKKAARGRSQLDGAVPAMAVLTEAAAAPAADEPSVDVRTNFADTALWIGAVTTDEEGLAEVPMTLPESLTSWRVRVWAVAGGTRVGQGETTCVTRKDLMVRLQAPRFLVETDEAVLSVVVRSELPTPRDVRVRLDVASNAIDLAASPEQSIRLEPNSEARVDWRVNATREAVVDVTATAVAEAAGGVERASDAMRLDVPVLVHGAEIVETQSATLGPDARLATFEIDVPDRRRPEATRLELRYTPTLVGAMVDALPYLIEYPHGCTEQTLNRFLPAVITRKTLEDLGVDLASLGPDADAEGLDGETPPVFDRDELDRLVRRGVRRLAEMQLADGGWGWFSGFRERSTPHTTAIVVRGLTIAERSGAGPPAPVLDRGVAWLVAYRAEQLVRLANSDEDGRPIDPDRPHKATADNLDALVQLVLAESGEFDAAMRDRLFADRLGLTPYSLAMLGLALHLESEEAEEASLATNRDRVLRNLRQFVVEDDETQTSYLNLPGGGWWYWHGSEFESHAMLVKLLAAVEPRGELAPRIVKHVLDGRRSARRWHSTRDTALVVEALGEYAVASGEAAPAADDEPMRVEVWLDGQRRQAEELTAAQALRGGGRFVLLGEELGAGRHTLELRKPAGRRLYAGVTHANFSLEPDLRAAGLDLRVQRRLFRLDPVVEATDTVDSRGGVVSIGSRRYRRVALPNLGSVRSGELVEVELNITSKNDYEYLVLEDPKPAGCEPIETRSGYNGNALGAYAEFRDRVVRHYAAWLPRGEHTLRYRVRAETPGEFSALPTVIEAMYAPDLRGNSDETRVRVLDAPDD